MSSVTNLWPIQQDKPVVITNIINDPTVTDAITKIEGRGFGSNLGTAELLNSSGAVVLDFTSKVSVWTDTEITFTTSLDMLGVNYVRITNSTLQLSSEPFKLIVDIASKYKPVIFSITPTVNGILPFTLEIKGENLLPVNQVFIGDQPVTVKNIWCTNTDSAGHALAPVTILATIPDGITTGMVRVDCEFGIAVGPVLKIEGPELTKTTPANIQIIPTQTTPYQVTIDGKWLANANTEWTFNGTKVTATTGSIRNRVSLSVNPALLIPDFDNQIVYLHGSQTASIAVKCNAAVITEPLIPELIHVPEAEYNSTITVEGRYTRVYDCALYLDEALITTTAWNESPSPEGVDTISFTVNNNIMPGWLQLRWEQGGVPQYSNVKELTFKAPRITDISTDTAVGGDEVVLTTENAYDRKNKSAVMLGNQACPIVSWTNEKVIFRLPLNAATGNIYLDTPYGKSNSYKITVESTYLVVPKITDISPKTGNLPLEIAINGEYFSSNTGEAFLGDLRLTTTKWTDKQVTVIIPSGAATANVRLKNKDWEISGPAFTVPEVTAVDTAYRKYAFNPYITSTSDRLYFSGDTVTVRGVNFKKGMTARIDYSDPITVNYVSGTEISFELPQGATTGYLTLVTSEELKSNSKLIKIKTGLPVITSFVPKKPEIGKYLTVFGSNFGTKTSLSTFRVRFGPGPYSTVSDSDIKLWDNSQIKLFLSPDLEYSTGKLQVISEGYSSNTIDIEVTGNADAPTSNISLAYISQGNGLLSNSGIQFSSITRLPEGSPKVLNLDAEKWDGKNWDDVQAFINDVVSGANSAAITLSNVKPNLLGNIILRGINGIVVLGNQTESGMQILIKPIEAEKLLVSLDNSTIATSFCDAFGVCRTDSKLNSSKVSTISPQIVSQVIKGPGIKITRYTSTGELYVNGMNISKERLVISPDFGTNSNQVLPGNHIHGEPSPARYSVSTTENNFYDQPDGRDRVVFGVDEVVFNPPEPVYEVVDLTKPCIYNIYPKKAPAGCIVGVIGKNFTASSEIKIGGVGVETLFVTPNELRFVVPENLYRSDLCVAEGAEESNKINFVRSRIWTDPYLTPKVTPIKALHLQEIKVALLQKLNTFGLPMPTYPAAQSGASIKGMDIYWLRHALNKYQFEKTLWTDDKLESTTYVQTIHIRELRWAVNDLIFDPLFSIAVDSNWNELRQECDAIFRDFVYNYASLPGYEAFLASIKDGYIAE